MAEDDPTRTDGEPEEKREPIPIDEIPSPEENDLDIELEEARDRALRSQAELENFRKRAARQMDEQRRYAHMPLMQDLLHVWDNMVRAIEAAENSEKTEGLLEGFEMVIQELEGVLTRHHCTKIEADGKPFDPHLHEAIMQQPSADCPPGTVTHVARTGFMLHDRVIRPSQVIVSAAAAGEDE